VLLKGLADTNRWSLPLPLFFKRGGDNDFYVVQNWELRSCMSGPPLYIT
jgi:hypothetical protein